MSAIEGFDEVKPFPSLLAPAKPRERSQNSRKKTRKPIDGTDTVTLPGLLKSSKPDITHGTATAGSAHLVGFNASHVRLDNASPKQRSVNTHTDILATLKQVNLNTQSNQPKKEKKTDVAISELRTYTALMDQYSLHNFMIWNGRALKSTPEFQSFHRTYLNDWSYILSVIAQLEKLMTENSVKLAIIAGVKVAEYASLNLPSLQNYQILDCVANVDQIRSEITAFEGDGNQQIIAATVKIQAIARQWYAMYKYREMKRRMGATVLLQSVIRRFVMRCRANALLKSLQAEMDATWESNKNVLVDLLKDSVTSDAKKLVIFIPSMTAGEFYRMQLSNVFALQNASISCLYQLADPNVNLVYISPRALSPTDLAYIEKFLNLMNISILPNRLKFIVPELSNQLPETTPVSQALWYSSSTLNKLRGIMTHYSLTYIIPSSAGWPEKRISHYLKAPMLSAEPVLSQELSSRSHAKRLFMQTNMSIPIGAHDVHTEDDLLIALTRLMSSNLDVHRWLIRLNTDFNNEGTAYIDVNKIPVILELRKEQRAMMHSHADPEAWFERHVQLNARKRILNGIQETEMHVIHICRQDLFPDYKALIDFVKIYGAVVEAEPPSIRGYVESYCLMHPSGDIHVNRGAVILQDENYQRQGVSFPQTLIHDKALEGATKALASRLMRYYNAIGFITVTYCVFWDGFDEISRLWASHISFGMNATYGALGTLACLTRPMDSPVSSDALFMSVPEGRSFVHVPSLMHLPLMTTRDDVFFKLCKMHGIAFDYERKTGILFFLVDSVIGGVLSFISIAETRIKSIEFSIHALSFILRNFGKPDERDMTNGWCNMNSVLRSLKVALKVEVARSRAVEN